MAAAYTGKPVERLFPFALRSRIVVAGRDALRARRKKLQLLIVTPDLSENSRESVAKEFPGVRVFQGLSQEEIERHFGFRGTKVIGFLRSPLAVSITRELSAREKAAAAETAQDADVSDTPSE